LSMTMLCSKIIIIINFIMLEGWDCFIILLVLLRHITRIIRLSLHLRHLRHIAIIAKINMRKGAYRFIKFIGSQSKLQVIREVTTNYHLLIPSNQHLHTIFNHIGPRFSLLDFIIVMVDFAELINFRLVMVLYYFDVDSKYKTARDLA
jgi:hypothetical protein